MDDLGQATFLDACLLSIAPSDRLGARHRGVGEETAIAHPVSRQPEPADLRHARRGTRPAIRRQAVAHGHGRHQTLAHHHVAPAGLHRVGPAFERVAHRVARRRLVGRQIPRHLDQRAAGRRQRRRGRVHGQVERTIEPEREVAIGAREAREREIEAGGAHRNEGRDRARQLGRALGAGEAQRGLGITGDHDVAGFEARTVVEHHRRHRVVVDLEPRDSRARGDDDARLARAPLETSHQHSPTPVEVVDVGGERELDLLDRDRGIELRRRVGIGRHPHQTAEEEPDALARGARLDPLGDAPAAPPGEVDLGQAGEQARHLQLLAEGEERRAQQRSRRGRQGVELVSDPGEEAVRRRQVPLELDAQLAQQAGRLALDVERVRTEVEREPVLLLGLRSTAQALRAFEQSNAHASARQQGGRDQTRQPAADDDH